LYVPLVA